MALTIQIIWQKHAQDVKFKLENKGKSFQEKLASNVTVQKTDSQK